MIPELLQPAPPPDRRFVAWRHPKAVVWLVLGLAACSESESWVPLDPQGALTFVLATATEPMGPWQITVGADVDSPVVRVSAEHEVLLLLYDEAPEDLGLRGPNPVSCRVLDPRSTLRLSGDDPTEVAGEPLPAALVEALVGDRFRCERCPPFAISPVVSDRSGRFKGAAWFDDDSALVASDQGFSRASRTQVQTLGACVGLTEEPRVVANAGPGRFWVGGDRGELSRVRFESGGTRCVVETSTSVQGRRDANSAYRHIGALAPQPDDPEAHDLLAVRATGEVFRWTAVGLVRLGRMENHPEAAEHIYPSIVRIDAERSVTSSGWNRVYRWRGDQLEREEVLDLMEDSIATQPRDRVSTLSIDPLAGQLLLGSLHGDVWARDLDGGEWSFLYQSPLVDAIGALVPLGRGFAVIQEAGELTFFHREAGGCETLTRLPLGRRSAPCRIVLSRTGRVMVADLLGSDSAGGGVIWIQDPSSEP